MRRTALPSFHFSKSTSFAPSTSEIKPSSFRRASAVSCHGFPTWLSPMYTSKCTFSRSYSSAYFFTDSSRHTRQFLSASSSPSSMRLNHAAAAVFTPGSDSASLLMFT